MTRYLARAFVAATLSLTPTIGHAGHSELTIPKSDTFLLGGEQQTPMNVTGRNVGTTDVRVFARKADKDVAVATIAPGKSFEHLFAAGEIAAILNMSSTADARLSVDFTGSPSDLSMRYVLPQKN